MRKLIYLLFILTTSIVYSQKPSVDVIRWNQTDIPPSTPQEGWTYMDETNGQIFRYNGIDWEQITGIPTNTSELINDGEDGVNPFITANDVQSYTFDEGIVNTAGTVTLGGTADNKIIIDSPNGFLFRQFFDGGETTYGLDITPTGIRMDHSGSFISYNDYGNITIDAASSALNHTVNFGSDNATLTLGNSTASLTKGAEGIFVDDAVMRIRLPGAGVSTTGHLLGYSNTSFGITSIDPSTIGGPTPTLQEVTTAGSTTTTSITANSFVKSGGTSGQFLLANGTTLSTSTYIPTSAVTGGLKYQFGDLYFFNEVATNVFEFEILAESGEQYWIGDQSTSFGLHLNYNTPSSSANLNGPNINLVASDDVYIDTSTGVLRLHTAAVDAGTAQVGDILNLTSVGVTGQAEFSSNIDIAGNIEAAGFGFFDGAITSSGLIKADQFGVSGLNTAPSSATDIGTEGEVRYTTTHIYVCIATNTWVRAALVTWP